MKNTESTTLELTVLDITEEEILQLIGETVPERFGDNNYQHTDYRCHYNPAWHMIVAEEICKNEHGGVFGREIYYNFEVPANRKVEWSGNWRDIEA